MLGAQRAELLDSALLCGSYHLVRSTDSGALLPPGRVIADQFQLERRLGAGGMGELYLAEQIGLGRRVAIKLVRQELMASRPELLERFRREARAMARINHPHVVQLYMFGQTEEGMPFFAMEYVLGRTLQDELGLVQIDVVRALQIAAQIAAALGAAHRCGVVHRDLKPANIMLADGAPREDMVKVLDFGIAQTRGPDPVDKLTNPGAFYGTPQYMSPEQLCSGQVDERSDIYALGLVLYEMLTGAPLVDGDNPYTQMFKQVSEPASPPSLRRPEVPPSVDALVLRCLEKAPEQRFASAEAFEAEATALAEALPAVPTHTRPPSRRPANPRHAAKTMPLPMTAARTERDGTPGGDAHEAHAAAPDGDTHGAHEDAAPAHARASAPLRLSHPRTEPLARADSHSPRGFVHGDDPTLDARAFEAERESLGAERPHAHPRGIGPLSLEEGSDVEAEPIRPRGRTRRLLLAGAAVVLLAAGALFSRPIERVVRRLPWSRATSEQALNAIAPRSPALAHYAAPCLIRFSGDVERGCLAYFAAIDDAQGPTRERHPQSVSVFADAGRCARAAERGSADTALDRYAQALSGTGGALTALTSEAAEYYRGSAWTTDELQRGRALHPRLAEAYRRSMLEARAFRREMEARLRAQDAAVQDELARRPDPLLGAVMATRQAVRGALRHINRPWHELSSIDPRELRPLRQELLAALRRVRTALPTTGSPADASLLAALESGSALIAEFDVLYARLRSAPRWTAGELLAITTAERTGHGAPYGAPQHVVADGTRVLMQLGASAVMREHGLIELPPAFRFSCPP